MSTNKFDTSFTKKEIELIDNLIKNSLGKKLVSEEELMRI